MKIFIPSMGRSTFGELTKGTLSCLDQVESNDIYYVVPGNEASNYSDIIGKSANVLSCPEKGIAKTRHWIGLYSKMLKSDKFLMLDDDIKFMVRKDENSVSLREASADEVAKLVKRVELYLDKYAHVGISARGGNNHMGTGDEHGVVNENSRTLRALAYRTEDFLSVEHGRVDVMEDFDVNLQLLRKGLPNINLGYWAQDQKMTNATGGCSIYRTHAIHERSAIKLSELHPDFVKLREKKNKTDSDGFGTRKEVTIQWKKAYASTQTP